MYEDNEDVSFWANKEINQANRAGGHRDNFDE
jgi:hypothetical protein